MGVEEERAGRFFVHSELDDERAGGRKKERRSSQPQHRVDVLIYGGLSKEQCRRRKFIEADIAHKRGSFSTKLMN